LEQLQKKNSTVAQSTIFFKKKFKWSWVSPNSAVRKRKKQSRPSGQDTSLHRSSCQLEKNTPLELEDGVERDFTASASGSWRKASTSELSRAE